jgi:hypothetical protein
MFVSTVELGDAPVEQFASKCDALSTGLRDGFVRSLRVLCVLRAL